MYSWGDSALSQVIILALSRPILDQNPNFILIPKKGPIRLDRKKAHKLKSPFFLSLSCYPAIFYFIRTLSYWQNKILSSYPERVLAPNIQVHLNTNTYNILCIVMAESDHKCNVGVQGLGVGSMTRQ